LLKSQPRERKGNGAYRGGRGRGGTRVDEKKTGRKVWSRQR